RAAEPPPALPRVLRHAALLAAIAGEKHHDPIRLTELVGPQDQRFGGVERHAGRPTIIRRRLFDADVAQDRIVLPPLRLDPDVQIEEDARVEELLEVLAGGDADPLDHVAAAADDDRLLRL